MDLFLGQSLHANVVTGEKYLFSTYDLLTHAFICGSTGSGKTVLGKILIEETARAGIPSILIDIKGDLSSLAIPISDVDYHEVREWVEARTQDEVYKKTQQLVTEFRQKLKNSDLSREDVRHFRSSVEVRILTPKSHLAEPFCLSLTGERPQVGSNQNVGDREILINSAAISAQALIERAFSKEERTQRMEEKCFLEELILHLWDQNTNLEGREGLVTLINSTNNPPFETIGVMTIDDFLPPPRRQELGRRLNSLLVGSESLWFEGKTMSSILQGIDENKDKRTPIIILNLSMLSSFQEKNLVLSHIAGAISTWMRAKITHSGPRLLFYLDEIGEGIHSFFPADPHQCASKTAINILLRQGRAFGVCCILSTQNPGDIDYKGLTNCHTWFVGKLLTKTDRSKVMQGISSFEYFADRFEDYIKTSDVGQFVVKTKFGRVQQFKERWLLSIHRVLSPEDYEKLYRTLRWSRLREEAQSYIDNKQFQQALEFLNERLVERPNLTQAWALKGSVLELQGNIEEALEAYEKVLSLEPHDSESWLRKSCIYITLGQPEEALSSLDKAISYNEQNDQAWFEKGRLLLELGDNEEAEKHLAKATNINTRRPEAWALLSHLTREKGDYKRALEYLGRAINLNPKVDSLIVERGRLYLLSDDPFMALETFDTALERCQDNIDALSGKATALIEIGERQKACEAIEQALIIDPKNLVNGLLRARVKEEDELYDEALNGLKELIEWHPESPAPLVRAASCYLALGNMDQALELTDKALNLDPDRGEAWLLKGNILAKEGQVQEAGEAYEKAVGSAPDLPAAIRQKARHHQKLGEWEKAVDTSGKLLKLAPGEVAAWYGKGICLDKMNSHDDALAALQHVQDVEQYRDIWALRARLFARTSQWAKARESFSKAIKINPGDDLLRLEAGITLRELGQYEPSLDSIDIFAKKHPDDPRGWREMGTTFRAMGDSRRAGQCFEKVDEIMKNEKGSSG
ncbi:MAG: DUF853 family protein [bacterium]|nr:DUF853 family protein [bacterium]